MHATASWHLAKIDWKKSAYEIYSADEVFAVALCLWDLNRLCIPYTPFDLFAAIRSEHIVCLVDEPQRFNAASGVMEKGAGGSTVVLQIPALVASSTEKKQAWAEPQYGHC
jgi:hypothetical protein